MINLAWGGLTNGQIDTSILVDISGKGDYLEPVAAAKFLAMRDALHAATGVYINPAPGSSCYRPVAIQEQFYDAYLAGTGNVAAVPTTRGGQGSNHGWARAIDITGYESSDAVWNWLLAHAGDYGYSWATGQASGERWHWESLNTPSANASAASVSSVLLNTTIPKEQEMHYYRANSLSTDGRIGNGYVYVQDAGGPLRAVDNLEGSYIAELEKQQRIFIASWAGDDIRSLASRVGILEYGAVAAGSRMTNGTPIIGVGRLTGKVIY